MEFIDNVIDTIEDAYADIDFDEGAAVATEDSGAPVPTEIEDLQNFDPSQATNVVGTPDEDMALWHQQETDTSCAIASQEFILDSFTGQDFTEAELRDEAEASGWWTPEGGTPIDDVGKLLEAHGVETDQQFEQSTDDLTEHLQNGEKIIVSVDSDEIWSPGINADDDTELGDSPGLPGQDVDHAVEVTGIVETPEGQMVVLNDPGHPDGQGSMMPIEEFESAWADGGNMATYATPPGDAPVEPVDEPVVEPAPVDPVDPYVEPVVPVDPVYVDPTYVEPVPVEPIVPVDPYVEPAPVDPTYVEPEPVVPVDPAAVDPSYVDPTYIEPVEPVDPYVEPVEPIDPYVEPVVPVDPAAVDPSYVEPEIEIEIIEEPVAEEPIIEDPAAFTEPAPTDEGYGKRAG